MEKLYSNFSNIFVISLLLIFSACKKEDKVIAIPSQLLLEDGDNQAGDFNAILSKPLKVKVIDANSDPVEGIDVFWSVTAGYGQVTSPSSLTDAEGIASMEWKLGSEGIQQAVAILNHRDGSPVDGSPLTFTANTPVLLGVWEAYEVWNEYQGKVYNEFKNTVFREVDFDQYCQLPRSYQWTVNSLHITFKENNQYEINEQTVETTRGPNDRCQMITGSGPSNVIERGTFIYNTDARTIKITTNEGTATVKVNILTNDTLEIGETLEMAGFQNVDPISYSVYESKRVLLKRKQ